MKPPCVLFRLTGLLLGAALTTVPAVVPDSETPIPQQHFTRWSQTASRFGVHEVFLTRDHTPNASST